MLQNKHAENIAVLEQKKKIEIEKRERSKLACFKKWRCHCPIMRNNIVFLFKLWNFLSISFNIQSKNKKRTFSNYNHKITANAQIVY